MNLDATANHLFLLADHIKLGLSDNVNTIGQEKKIRQSLTALKNGITSLQRHRDSQTSAGQDLDDLSEQITRLNTKYTSLEADYTSSYPSTAINKPLPPQPSIKSVRFQDDPFTSNPQEYTQSLKSREYTDDPENDQERGKLFSTSTIQRYTDNEDDVGLQSSHGQLSNLQIHAAHKDILKRQDEHLDLLAGSVSRQKDLSIQIGGELEVQNGMLDEVDGVVNRQDERLKRAKKRLEGVARKAKDNWSWVTITCLVLILLLLIIVVK